MGKVGPTVYEIDYTLEYEFKSSLTKDVTEDLLILAGFLFHVNEVRTLSSL